MMFTISQKQGPHGSVLVVTDSDILGKTFEEGKLQLDLSKEFYKGEEKNKEEVVAVLKKFSHLHLTGKGAVAIGVEQDYVDPQKILFVQGVPHAEVVVEG